MLGDKLGAIVDFKKAVCLDPECARRNIPGLIIWSNSDVVDSATSALASSFMTLQKTLSLLVKKI
jgi:hypothetical protein